MRILLATVPVLALAACATPADKYPSLSVRDVERAQGRFEPVPAPPLDVPEVPVRTDGTLAQQLAALDSAAAQAHAAFLGKAPAAARLAAAAAGAAIASPTWAAAQVALADLESARSATAIPLGELDALMVAAAIQAEDVAAIEAVRQRVLAQIAQEDETLASLRARLR